MSEITIFGPAPSSYVRTARWACAEKGVAHELKPVEFGSDAHRKLHPFCKVPILRHGNHTLPETLAIVQYIDGKFDGPTLTPTDANERSEAFKWVSHLNANMYSRLIPDYVLQYVLPGLRGEEPDREAIDAGVPGVKQCLDLLDEGIGDSPWFVGNELSIADLFVAPVISSVARLPEAAAILEDKKNLKRFMNNVEKREAWQSVQPQQS